MAKSPHHSLSRRERQIMDVVYRKGEATAAEVYEALADPPAETSVRKLIRILEQKGHLAHRRDGLRHVYRPTVPREEASRSAVQHLVSTFFDGSPARAVAALLDSSRDGLSADEAERLRAMIEDAAGEGR